LLCNKDIGGAATGIRRSEVVDGDVVIAGGEVEDEKGE
jgi:hypothetical protein